MSSKYFQVYISAENRKQADKILDSLLKKKLVAGGLILQGPSRFLWKGKIVDMNYINISTFTKSELKKGVIEDVKKISVEEVPMIWFVEFEGNRALLNWIDESLR